MIFSQDSDICLCTFVRIRRAANLRNTSGRFKLKTNVSAYHLLLLILLISSILLVLLLSWLLVVVVVVVVLGSFQTENERLRISPQLSAIHPRKPYLPYSTPLRNRCWAVLGWFYRLRREIPISQNWLKGQNMATAIHPRKLGWGSIVVTDVSIFKNNNNNNNNNNNMCINTHINIYIYI